MCDIYACANKKKLYLYIWNGEWGGGDNKT